MTRFAPHFNRTRLTALALCVLIAFFASATLAWRNLSPSFDAGVTARGRMADFPSVFLWAWERPEKFDFIDTRQTGVAYLARTLYLRGERVVVRPRLQPLEVPAGTRLVAVARIEVDRDAPPSLSAAQLRETVEAVAGAVRGRAVSAVQIDFDARVSEREFYRELLSALRRELPDSTALSMTALASWCTHERWLADLPVDEVVPMFFRMGADSRRVDGFLRAGEEFAAGVCRTSAGVSTDEPVSTLPAQNRRLYVFNPRSWTRADSDAILQRYRNEN
ncbi:MAG TPA: DUF3142 domain-containing protein [Pyrinomonadaceae bacterium]|nr:DUF3142 domain-containing protein [Pyrinomonadaceae bacterium]